jgi:N-acetylglucosamine kinase-like BadF-type ATPase
MKGAGYWIAQQGLNRAARSFDRRLEEPTILVDYALDFFKLSSFDELIRAIYNRPFRKEELAAFAPCVTAAAKGDSAALAILKQAGAETSGLAAQDLCYKLLRIGIHAAFCSDSHMQNISTALLTKEDVVIFKGVFIWEIC